MAFVGNMKTIYFLVTIDTEEDNAWSLDFKPHSELSVENINYLPKFQEFCNKLGVRPTYLIDYPVAVNKDSAKILKNIAQEDGGEIATHVHPWCNPPYVEERNHRHSYLNNLPEELQFQKLKTLTEIITENIGVRPVSYRAGRYGFDHTTIPVLEKLNYRVDSSVVPYRKNKHVDEPNFDFVPLNPYYLHYQNVCLPGESRLLEVPITVEFTRKLPQWFKKNYSDFPDIGIRKLLRVFLGINLVWLRPSYASLQEMKKAAEVTVRSGVNVLNMMFHSSELMPGGSPYNRTAEDVEHFLQKIEALILYLQTQFKIEFVTLKQMADLF